MKKDFTDSDVVYMIETIIGYLDSGRVDEAKQHLENLQHWFIQLPINGGLAKPTNYAEEFENQLGNPIEQVNKLIKQAKSFTTTNGSSQSGVAPTPKGRPLTIKDTKWTGVSELNKDKERWIDVGRREIINIICNEKRRHTHNSGAGRVLNSLLILLGEQEDY